MNKDRKQLLFQTAVMTACFLVFLLLVFATLNCKKQHLSNDNGDVATDAFPFVIDGTMPEIPMGMGE